MITRDPKEHWPLGECAACGRHVGILDDRGIGMASWSGYEELRQKGSTFYLVKHWPPSLDEAGFAPPGTEPCTGSRDLVLP